MKQIPNGKDWTDADREKWARINKDWKEVCKPYLDNMEAISVEERGRGFWGYDNPVVDIKTGQPIEFTKKGTRRKRKRKAA